MMNTQNYKENETLFTVFKQTDSIGKMFQLHIVFVLPMVSIVVIENYYQSNLGRQKFILFFASRQRGVLSQFK